MLIAQSRVGTAIEQAMPLVGHRVTTQAAGGVSCKTSRHELGLRQTPPAGKASRLHFCLGSWQAL
eukprot:6489994-Amphidinium_carterae.2